MSGPCYSDDTEVLTRRGWLKFSDTLPGDEFATRHPKTKALEWQQPTYFHKEAWQGDLLNFHGQTLDILVTPNHRMLVNSRSRGTMAVAEPHGDDWIIPAGELAEHGTITQLIPLVSENVLPDLLSFKVPSSQTAYNEYVTFDAAEFRAARKHLGLTQTQLAKAAGCSYVTANKVDQGGSVRLRLAERLRDILGVPFASIQADLPFTEMSGDDFAAFMGMWLAEGSVTWHGNTGKKRRPTIYVTQARDSRGWMPYRDLLTRLLGRSRRTTGTRSTSVMLVSLSTCVSSATPTRSSFRRKPCGCPRVRRPSSGTTTGWVTAMPTASAFAPQARAWLMTYRS